MLKLNGTVLLLLLAALLTTTAYGKPYGDDNNDVYTNEDYEDGTGGVVGGDDLADQETEESVIHRIPKFIVKSENLMINEGGTIRLPCLFNRLEGFVLLWKKGDEIITVGKQIVKEENRRRFQLSEEENGNNLVISLAEEQDAGKYTCQVSTYKPTEITHTVHIRVKPEIRPIPDNGIIVAESGNSVTLECEVVRGSPTPEVVWRRKERKMPTGEEEIRGLSLTYKAVNRHHSGIYICSADNGFGEPSSAVLKLDVQHAPEIEQEEAFIHTKEGDETEVICVIHSSPKADVTWYKNGTPLDPATYNINHIGNRHTLTLPITSQETFGQYTCKAYNQYGESQKTTEVSGKAEPAVILSDPKGLEFDRFPLEWTAKSFSDITSFRVEFKSTMDGTWSSEDTPAYKLPNEEHKYTGTYIIPDLHPATVYLVRVSSQNSYGLSNPSQVFQFATRGADPVQKPITGSSASSKVVSSFVVSIATASMGFLFLL